MLTKDYFIFLSIGLLLILLLSVFGAILSRKFNFRYTRLSSLSFFIYIGMSYCVALQLDRTAAITIAGLLGLFDATIGWRIAFWLKPNWGGLDKEMPLEAELPMLMVLIMVLFSLLIGLIGSFIALSF